MPDTFKAILVSRDADKNQSVTVTDLTEADLMEGDVTVAVEATTVNYKDGLAITGKAPVVRRWPMVPGIDFAGTVLSSDHPDWRKGDRSSSTAGASAKPITAPMPCRREERLAGAMPDISAHDAMWRGHRRLYGHAVGDAGAPRSLWRARWWWRALPAASARLHRGPFRPRLCHRIDRRSSEADYLRDLGAAEIIAREELSGPAAARQALGRRRRWQQHHWPCVMAAYGGARSRPGCRRHGPQSPMLATSARHFPAASTPSWRRRNFG